jgi:hypothetical protein
MTTVTNLTNPTTAFSSATIVMAGTGTQQGGFNGGGLTYGTVTFTGHASIGGYQISGANTFATLNITAPNSVQPTLLQTHLLGLEHLQTGSISHQALLTEPP